MSRPIVLPTITTRDRLRRYVWGLARWILFWPTPVVMHRWRRWILCLFGARLARKAYVYPDALIWAPWNLEMSDGSCLGPSVNCYNVTPVRLGPGVTVSQRSHLCTASHDFDDPAFPLAGAPINLEKGSWVAAEAFIGPGVTVGARAVVLARAVVVRDVSPGVVVGGNPARYLRDRETKKDEAAE